MDLYKNYQPAVVAKIFAVSHEAVTYRLQFLYGKGVQSPEPYAV